MRMNDAISRSDALESAELLSWYHANQKGKMVPGAASCDEAYVEFNDVVSLLENATALDVAPVVHARWIMNHFGAKCSNCLRLYCVEPSWSEKIKHMPPTWIYCPNCGARMDGEAE